jgi:hypothetical protein
MVMLRRHIDLNLQMFKDYLETGNLAAVGVKHGLQERSAYSTVGTVRMHILRMLDRYQMPLPKNRKRVDVKNEKAYWLDMLQTYHVYLTEYYEVNMGSLVGKIGINGMAVEKLNRLEIYTVSDLLGAMQTDKPVLVKTFKYIYPSIKDIEKRLQKLGLDPYGGREQTIKQPEKVLTATVPL